MKTKTTQPGYKAPYGKYGTYDKIIKAIDSCFTIEQLSGCVRMVNKFQVKYNDEPLTNCLVYSVQDKTFTIFHLNKSVENLINISLYK